MGSEYTNVCPTCGKELTNVLGMKQHHATQHGESLTKETYECDNCGDKFRRRPCDNDNDGNYCSKECHYEEHSENMSGENSNFYQGGRLITVECSYCGESITDYKARLNNHEKNFCDKSCNAEWRKENYVGENNPVWEGGSANYGGSWQTQRRKTLERDGYECRACGMTNERHNELYGKNLDVHHVVPLRNFNDPEDANSLGNLVTACKKCHAKYEGVPVFPE